MMNQFNIASVLVISMHTLHLQAVEDNTRCSYHVFFAEFNCIDHSTVRYTVE